MAVYLIAGGSGHIGRALTRRLISLGHEVRVLGRTRRGLVGAKEFVWAPEKSRVEVEAFLNADFVINLAGAGIADKKWTLEYRKILVDSRLNSTKMVVNQMKHLCPEAYLLSASAVGYYGPCGNEWVEESRPPSNTFMAKLCAEWENEANQFTEFGGSTGILRIGVVLDVKSGALPKLAAPCRLGFGAALGSGMQMIPWIHQSDLVSMMIFACENRLKGTYNATAPHPINNQEMTAAISKSLNRPFFLPHVPAFLLRMVLGEMSAVVLEGQRCASGKIEKAGFKYKFNTIEEALKDLWA